MMKRNSKEVIIFRTENIDAVKRHLEKYPCDIPRNPETTDPNKIFTRDIDGLNRYYEPEITRRDILFFIFGQLLMIMMMPMAWGIVGG